MDNQTTSVLALCGIIVSGITTAITAMNHRRIRSTCCGKVADVSLDIEATTPPKVTQTTA